MTTKKTKILIHIETGRVWPVIKVTDTDGIEVIVLNSDQHTLWKPKMDIDSEEVERLSQLAQDLEEQLGPLAKRIKESK